MPKLCKECEHFRIMNYPENGVDFGHAVCTEHYLITEFLSMKKFNYLYCVEKEEGNATDHFFRDCPEKIYTEDEGSE